MAFQGWLIKINGVEFPSWKFIQLSTYKSTPNQKQDEDSYRDADGLLHRNILPHTCSKIEFNTPHMHLDRKTEFQSFFSSGRETLTLDYWNDEINDYSSGTFYTPDISYEIYSHSKDDIIYKPIRVAFIEY